MATLRKNTDVETIIRTRRAVRHFKPDPIPDEILYRILNSARLAPSSKNSQPWHFIVIKNKKTLQELAKMTYTGDFLPDAPLAIATVLENAKLETDAARAIQNMVLTAWKYKIGTVWITNFWEKAKKILGIPMTGNYKLITVMPFGYIYDDSKSRGKKHRKKFEEIVHSENFENPLKLDFKT
ncbi:MAG: nitroreductase family protein [Candidatus Hermodarchaeota archaeon]